MAEELNPIKTLATAKEKLIEERRTLAIALALRRRRDEHVDETGRSFINVQDLIEAIERAIAHEKRIKNERPESIVGPVLEATQVTITPTISQ
jgi:hypothetical protein